MFHLNGQLSTTSSDPLRYGSITNKQAIDQAELVVDRRQFSFSHCKLLSINVVAALRSLVQHLLGVLFEFRSTISYLLVGSSGTGPIGVFRVRLLGCI